MIGLKERFVIALTSAEYNWVDLLAVLNSLHIFHLFPGLPEGVYPRDQGAREVDKRGRNGLGGVSRKKDGRESGLLVGILFQFPGKFWDRLVR